MKPIDFSWLFFFLFLSHLHAQDDTSSKYASFNFGTSVIDELLPEGEYYTPLTILGTFSIWSWAGFNIYGEVQLAQSFASTSLRTDYEFGFNMGLTYRHHLSKELQILGSIGAGPHYVTVDTRRQADGFIFSDNFEAGFVYWISAHETVVNCKVRYRHISNAGLQEPNGGIDNLFVVVGVGKRF